MMDIMRRDSESNFEYKLRLCMAKLDKELDLDWTEIVELLGLECSADHLRKVAYGMREYYNYIQENPNKFTEHRAILEEIEQKTLQLEKEKIKYQDQKREYNKLVRESARWEHLRDTVESSILRLEEVKPLIQYSTPNISSNKKNELVVLLSDWHFGLECENFWNTFNESIFNKRIETLTHKIIEVGKLHRVNKLNIFSLGDMVNGLIHTTTRIGNSENVIEQVQVVAETLSNMCNYLSTYFIIDFYNINGNHDRVVANKSDNLDEESFSYLIDWFMRARLRNNKRINIKHNTIDKGIIVTEICGHKVFGVHGDKDRPITSIDSLTNMIKIFPRFIFMGHFHSNFEANRKGIDVIVNGCLSGVDAYAKEKRLYSQPMQKIMVFNEKGRECTYDVEF